MGEFKALAPGASAVCIGWPYLWGFELALLLPPLMWLRGRRRPARA